MPSATPQRPMPSPTPEPPDDAALELWQATRRRDSARAYEAYLATYPDGEFSILAARRLEELRAAAPSGELDPLEEVLWRRAVLTDDPEDYIAYLAEFPGGANAGKARARLRELGVLADAPTLGPTLGPVVTPIELPEPSPTPAPLRLAPSPTPVPSPAAPDPAAAAEQEAELGLNRRDRREVQRRLSLMGFDPGPVDGVFGPRTRRAIERWQRARGFAPTGYLDRIQLDALTRQSQAAYMRFLQEARARPTRAPVPERGPAGCPRNGRGQIIPGYGALCDSIGAAEAIGNILGR